MDAPAIAQLVAERLRAESARLRAEFARPRIGTTRCALMDDVLPAELARRIYDAFPPEREMRLMSSFREQKYTSKALERMEKNEQKM